MEHGLVLAISGRTTAGKTTLARALHQRLGWPCASFGDYVRAEARSRGLSEEREVLQQLGAGLIAELGWVDFCRAVLASAGVKHDTTVLVDGVRHGEVLDALRDLFRPVPVYLIHIDIPDETRTERLARGGILPERANALDEHSTERQVRVALRARADLLVPGNDVASAVDDICSWLAKDDATPAG